MNTLATLISQVLSNFDLSMFILAMTFIVCACLKHNEISPHIIYRWFALFSLGIAGMFACMMHVFFPEIVASAIGWDPSPFQYEVGIADLTIGVLGLLSFHASIGFRLATVIAATCWMWGDVLGHTYHLWNKDFTLTPDDTWFWIDLILPFILLLTIYKMKNPK
jgi:hypothetical protein